MLIAPGVSPISFSRRTGILRGGENPTFTLDLMTGSNGTAMQNHPMDSGLGWASLQGVSQIQSNAMNAITSGTASVITTQTLYAGGALAEDITLPGSGQFTNGLRLRSSNVNTGYDLLLENDGVSTRLCLYELDGLI